VQMVMNRALSLMNLLRQAYQYVHVLSTAISFILNGFAKWMRYVDAVSGADLPGVLDMTRAR